MVEDIHFPHASADIIMQPPENACGNVTDEDSGDEDLMHYNNLPGTQLRGEAEMRVPVPTIEEFDEEDEIPLSSFVDNTSKKCKKPRLTCTWIEGGFEEYIPNVWPQDIDEEIKNKTPIQLFELFFTEDLIQKILTESNRYALQHNKISNISVKGIKCVLGILTLSGYIQIPQRRMLWQKLNDTNNTLVSNSISRDRFEFILSNFHLADNNNLTSNDKFAKVRPLFDHLNATFLKYAPCQEMHSVDEAMVPYYGRHGCKQYIHGKPIRYGFKFWMGCTRLGYVNWFEPYQRASTHIGVKYKELGVGAGVVLTYADVLQSKWPNLQFHLFFDNFF